ncbi:hypothetical protein B0H14DRAFT_3708157 [Mycena olivaceomarginata]|nr:hypothetical protein B0H14DRAFT_3708157 [Mycena olivaceomarginata]
MQAHPVPIPASTISESPSHHLLELAHGTPIPRSDDTQRRGRRSRSPRAPTLELAHGTPIPRSDDKQQRGRRSCSPRAPTLELAHGTPIPRLDDTARSRVQMTHGGAGVGPAAHLLPPNLRVALTLSTRAHARHPDPAFGRHTRRRGHRSRSPPNHLTCMIPVGSIFCV